MLKTQFCSLALIGLWFAPAVKAAPPPHFELRDGDRVVLLGDTLIEREQHFGYLELALTTRFADRNVTFRNIGWSADTPAGDSRFGLSLVQAGTEAPDEGWKQLCEQLRQLKPTVVILGYGMASSFAGEVGLPKFKIELERLIDSIQQQASETKVRFLFLGPVPVKRMPYAPDATQRNDILSKYSTAIEECARRREAPFVSLMTRLQQSTNTRLTDNGIHLNANGYRALAEAVEDELSWPAGKWRTSPQSERLRQALIKKNELFFHRSRPANMAYIFGFRKREQGRNAVEIPQFDPLIAAEEQVIAKLRTLEPIEPPPEPKLRTESTAAKFTPQPHPSFQVADGFEISLWAENPMLAKPIQMNFDPRGRLWVASSEVYPQIEPGQAATDKIIILEDTTGAGHADKATIFADGLLIPTGLEPGDGGVYVGQSTELLHLRDTDGDGKADTRRIVLSGFGTEDTHHNLHTLRWGPDGRLYMNQSVYTRTDTETPNGVVRLKGGGVFRFDPQAGRMEILFRGWWNAWGHQFDRFGQSFLTDGAGTDAISYGLPGASYIPAPKARRILASVSPGSYPKFSSLEIIYSKHFPTDWQGDYITCDFRANKVVRFKVEDNGAGYVTTQLPDLLRSSDVTFRPIDVKLGPDGALYIADWSNPIINHGEVDFRDPRRDRWHGRIWRVTAKGRPLNPRLNLVNASTPALLDTLLSENSFDRNQARRVLIERGLSIMPELAAWKNRHADDESRLQALWLHSAVHLWDYELVVQLMSASDGRIRAAAVRSISDVADQHPHALRWLTERITDEYPRVRLEAVRALARIPSATAAEAALRVLDQPMDRFLDYALWLTVNDLAGPLLELIKEGALDGQDRKLEFVLNAVESSKAAQVLGKLLARQQLTRDGKGPWIELIGKAGSPSDLQRLVEQVLSGGFDDTATARGLSALADAARSRQARPAGDSPDITKLLDNANEPIRLAALRLVGAWRLSAAGPRVREFAMDRHAAANIRTGAIEALRELPGAETVACIRKIMSDKSENRPIRGQAAVSLLAVATPAESVAQLREFLAETGAEPDANSLWRAVLSAGNFGNRLAADLRDHPLPPAVASAGLKIARETAGRHQDLVTVLTRQSGDTAPRVYVGGDVERMAAMAKLTGNAARGEVVYRRPELRCISCHAIGGAGGKVGPDLTSVGAAAPLDYLVESIYLPDKAVKEGFHSVQIETADGRVTTGIVVRETERDVLLRDAESKEISIPRATIRERSPAKSLMPVGLVDHLFENEQKDLFRFLSELGKPGPFDAARNQSAKAWRIAAVNASDAGAMAKAQQGDEANTGWFGITTTVSGALLKSELSALPAIGNGKDKVVYAATRFEVLKPGRVTFSFGKDAPTSLWIDGKVSTSKARPPAELMAGVHTLVIRLDLASMPDRLTLRSPDVVFRPD